MNTLKITSAAVFLAALSFSAQSDAKNHNWGRGQVSVQGSIIDAACAISTESRDQTLAIGTHSISSLKQGQEVSNKLTIELINCVQKPPDINHPDNNQFQVTFDGEADGLLFGVSGDAKGIAIEITDGSGHIVQPGKVLPAMKVTAGNMTLNYKIKIISNAKRVIPGNYHSSIRFKMDYF